MQNEAALNETLQAEFAKRDMTDMMQRLSAADVMAAPVNTFHETFADPQVRHNNMTVEVGHVRVGKLKVGGIPAKLKKTPGAVRLPPPTLGQHTWEILQEMGLSGDEVEHLKHKGVAK